MFANYLKAAWRNIAKSKIYTTLNVLSLTTGLVVVLLIGLWIYYEYSYDRFLPGNERIYQVKLNHQHEGGIITMDAAALPLGEALQRSIPEIKYVSESDWSHEHGLVIGEKKVYIKGQMVGSDFLNIFQFDIIKGSRANCLKDMYSIVLTESAARSLFGEEDPINKIVKLDNKDGLTVTAVIKDLPGNSSFDFQFLVPFNYFEQAYDWMKGARTQWTNNSFQLFVALQEGASYPQVASKIKNLVTQNTNDATTQVIFHPLTKWRLYSDFRNGKAVGGFIDYVRMFSIIGILVLGIACINFINLSTARSQKRAKEVGLRKAIGADRRDLIFRFLTESLLLTFIAFFLSIILVQLFLPKFNALIQSAVRIPYLNIYFWLIMIGATVIVGLLAGSKPAFYLSSFQPVKVLKGTIKVGKDAAIGRKVMIVLQFTCSVALIISTMVIYQQVQHAKDRPKGYNPERLMMTNMTADLERNYTALANELQKQGLVENITRASSPVTDLKSHTVIEQWANKSSAEDLNIGAISISGTYFQTLGIRVKSGREFHEEWSADTGTVIINEAAGRAMGMKEPVGQIITWNSNHRATIVGVVADAVMESPFTPVAPTVYVHGRGGNNIIYRLAGNMNVRDALPRLAAVFDTFNPAYPYNYQFVHEAYARKFQLETLLGKLSALFSILAIFISCLGLFGLATFVAEQRIKEIGIRKVLGASVFRLWLLLSKDFFILVLISCLIATPLAWYFLQKWLDQYNYSISINGLVFVLAAFIAIFIAMATTSYQAIKAATTNPTKSIRSDN